MTSSKGIAIASLLSPSKSNSDSESAQASTPTPAANQNSKDITQVIVPLSDSSKVVDHDKEKDEDDDLIIIQDNSPVSVAVAVQSSSKSNPVKSTKKVKKPVESNPENGKPIEEKPKKKYVRKAVSEGKKSTKPKSTKPKSVPSSTETNKSQSRSPTPESRSSIGIMNLINNEQDSSSPENTILVPTTTVGTENKSTKGKPITLAPKKQPDLKKDGKPRLKPGPKPGYKKKPAVTGEGKNTVEPTLEEIKGDGKLKNDNSIPSTPTNANELKPNLHTIEPKSVEEEKAEKEKNDKSKQDKDDKVKKNKEEKPKLKKDSATTKSSKKETKQKNSTSLESSSASEMTYQEKMNKSLLQPNPQSKIPEPRIVEVTPSSKETSPFEKLDSLSDATKTKNFQLTSTPLEDLRKKTEEPIIALHVPLCTSLEKSGSKQVVFNVMKMSEESYGFNKIHPNSSRLQDLLNLDDDIEIIDDDDELEDDEDLEPEPKQDGRKSQKGKAKIGQYDYNDPFIDDAETLWEDQRASTKDGFFVFYGPLVEENLRIEKADGKIKRNRKRVANTKLSGNVTKKQNISTNLQTKQSNSLQKLAPKPTSDVVKV